MPIFTHEVIEFICKATSTEDLVNGVKSSKCILFLGAGAHFHSPSDSAYHYPESLAPPLGGKFSTYLAGKCDFATLFPNEPATNLQRVAHCYEIAKTRNLLVEEIQRAVQVGKKPSPILHALARLPFSLIITTNYDDLFEKALRAAGKNPKVGIYNKGQFSITDDYGETTQDEPFVFKIHGDIHHPESIVITDEDYIQFVLRMTDKLDYHPVPETFRFRFKRWPTLFVGYSLLDYNLRLLFMTLRWNVDRTKFADMYSVDPLPDPLIFDVWSNQNKYVTFIVQDVWKFIPELYRMVTGTNWSNDAALAKAITG